MIMYYMYLWTIVLNFYIWFISLYEIIIFYIIVESVIVHKIFHNEKVMVGISKLLRQYEV